MASLSGSCLCGSVAWAVDGAPEFMSHCHCARCRKAHGAPFATFVMVPVADFRLLRGGEDIVSPMPLIDRDRNYGVVPAGSLDDDPGTRPAHHIFVGSKAPWYEITDTLPQYAEFPPATG